MTGVFLTAFFALSTAIGCTALYANLRRYLPAFRANRLALEGSGEHRDVRYSIRTVEVRPLGAQIYRPDFTAAKRDRAQPLRVAA